MSTENNDNNVANENNKENKNNTTNNTNTTNENNDKLQEEFKNAFTLYKQKEYTVVYSDENFKQPIRLNLTKSIRIELKKAKQLDLEQLPYVKYDKGAHLLFDLVKRELDTLNYVENKKQATTQEEE